jgi:hypothetical protein
MEVAGQRALPQQPEVREHDGLVDAFLIQQRQPRFGVDEAGRQRVVVPHLGRQALAHAPPVRAHRVDVAWMVHLDEVDAAAAMRQPGVPEVVVLEV